MQFQAIVFLTSMLTSSSLNASPVTIEKRGGCNRKIPGPYHGSAITGDVTNITNTMSMTEHWNDRVTISPNKGNRGHLCTDVACFKSSIVVACNDEEGMFKRGLGIKLGLIRTLM